MAQQQRGVWITIAVLCALVGYVAWRITAPYAEALLTGFALAAAFYPLYSAIERRTRGRSSASLLATTVVVVSVLIPLILISVTIVRELQQGLQAVATDGGWESSRLRYWIDAVSGRFGSSAMEIEDSVRARAQELAAALLKGSVSVIGAAGGGIIQGIVTIGATHFGFYYGHSASERILAYSPLGDKRTRTLLHTMYDMVRASFYGVIAVAAAQGVLLGIAAWIAGLPAPVLWGVAAAMVSVLPVVGSALVWVPGTIVLLMAGKTGMAIFFLVWCAALVANIDNLVRPLIVMATLPVSGLLIFIAILGGIQAFGLIGVFVGPVTLAVGLALLRMLREEMQASNEEF